MKREIFRRGVRMVHTFGTLEQRSDPLGSGTFEPRFPMRPNELSSPPLEIHTHGEYRYREAPSAIVKPNGTTASLSGPAPDMPEMFAIPVPVSTRKRKEHK